MHTLNGHVNRGEIVPITIFLAALSATVACGPCGPWDPDGMCGTTGDDGPQSDATGPVLTLPPAEEGSESEAGDTSQGPDSCVPPNGSTWGPCNLGHKCDAGLACVVVSGRTVCASPCSTEGEACWAKIDDCEGGTLAQVGECVAGACVRTCFNIDECPYWQMSCGAEPPSQQPICSWSFTP